MTVTPILSKLNPFHPCSMASSITNTLPSIRTSVFFNFRPSKSLNSRPLPKSSISTLNALSSYTFSTISPLKSTSRRSSDHSHLDPPSSIVSASSSSLKYRLHSGETLYGIFLLSFSPTIAEIAGLSGYDFVVVDMEHGPGGISEALSCLRALAATQTPAILRLPESSAVWAKKALDLGPQGIMFPMVESATDAEKAVSYCRFPPAGVRGSAHTVVRASKYGIDDGYLSSYEDELLIMCQVESSEGVSNIEEISAVDGVDCIQMGPLDLSASMGYLWDPGNRKVREKLRAAEKAVVGAREKSGSKSGGPYLGAFAMPHDGPSDLLTRGYNMVSGTVDVGLFRIAAVEDVKRFRAALMSGSDEEVDEGGDSEKYWSE